MRSLRGLPVIVLLLVAALLLWLLRGESGADGTQGVLGPGGADGSQARELPVAEATPKPVVESASGESPSGPAQPVAAAPGETRLIVRVTWERDGGPVADCALRLLAWDGPKPLHNIVQGRTDAQGVWTLVPAPLGSVTAYSDRSASASGIVRAGETTELALVNSAGSLVRGVVLDPERRAVPGADIWLSGYGNETVGSVVARSGTDGRFELRDVGAWHSVGARAAGHMASPLVRVDEDAPPELDIELRLGAPGAALLGLVVDQSEAPVASARVLVGPEHGFPGPDPKVAGGGPPPVELRTAGDGRFEVADLPPGTLPVGVVAEGFSPWTGWTEVVAGETAELRIVLPPGAVVAGTARDADGRALAGVRVMAGERYGEVGWVETESGADGRFELRDPPTGDQRLQAAHKESGRDARTFFVEPGGAYAWDPVLTLGLQIRGRVSDASGEPVEGLHVQCERSRVADGWRRTADVAVDGAFVLDNCDDREHDLSVFGADWSFPPIATVQGVKPGPEEVRVVLPVGARTPATLVGRVVDGAGAVPAGLEVVLRDAGSPFGQGGRVEAQTGAFTIEQVRAGSHELWISGDDHSPHVVPVVNVRGGERRDLGLVVLPQPGRVVARLRLAAGLDPATMHVSLSTGKGWMQWGVLAPPSDGSDEWRSNAVPAGEYELGIRGQFVVRQSLPVRVEPGRETRLEIVVEKGVMTTLSFVMQYAEQRQVHVRVRDAGEQVVLDQADVADPFPHRGESRSLAQLVARPGRYGLVVDLDGLEVLRAEFDVPAGEDVAPMQEFRLD